MAEKEKYGTRDLSYSKWHRAASTRRFIGEDGANKLAMIDADVCIYVEYADNIKKPLVLIETAMDVGQSGKTATVTKNLADAANIPAFVVLYKVSETEMNPSDTDYHDIEHLRYKSIGRLSPTGLCDHEFVTVTPCEWAKLLVRVRDWSAKNLGIFVP